MRPSVLLVDDSPALIDNLTEILDEAGYVVRSAGTIADASRIAAQGFDVALVDLQLPDGNGGALATQLKEKFPESEVVLLTGFANFESAQAAIKTGACAYLVKPCAVPELLLTVGQAMRQVQLRGEKHVLARRAQVAEKLAAVGTLTAGLSHEIRNPLNSASLQLAVLERRVRKLDNEAQPTLLEPLLLVRDEIRRLDHILEDFLQFARPRDFVPRRMPIAEIVERTGLFLQGDAEKRSVALEVQCNARPTIAGEEGRLRQVLINLTLNALDAAPKGGRVCLTVDATNDDALIHVDDTGSGVPPEVRERIFEPFFTTKAAGSGLGLPIVNAIVIQHGGRITIERAPGGGARFTVSLPRAAG